jgi:carboxyl-terminal processing protease
MKTFRITIALIVIAALGGGFAAGYFYSRQEPVTEEEVLLKEVVNRDVDQPDTVDFSLFWQVWERLHDEFVDHTTLDTQALVYGAIHGMVEAAGDPYTVFLEPVDNAKFQEEISGSFSGVGMEITDRDGRISVVAPLKGTPAFEAGIKSGDVIRKVDDESTEGMSVEEAVMIIRGERGSTVLLTVDRAGVAEQLVFSIVRDTIRIPAVEWQLLDGNIAYLQLLTFNQNIDEEFATASREILASEARYLIVDVRNNPGGLLDSAVNLAGWFLPTDSVVVQEDFGDGIVRTLRTNGNGKAQLASLPTVFLINGGSASASEIIAGAVHDLRGVRLVGEDTFGKGSVQQLEQFRNGSSLKVTVAKWLTPSGTSISETGISPTDLVEIDYENLGDDELEFGVPGKDAQLDRAVEIVQSL